MNVRSISLDMELMRIAIEATAFVLDDRFEGLKHEWEKRLIDERKAQEE